MVKIELVPTKYCNIDLANILVYDKQELLPYSNITESLLLNEPIFMANIRYDNRETLEYLNQVTFYKDMNSVIDILNKLPKDTTVYIIVDKYNERSKIKIPYSKYI